MTTSKNILEFLKHFSFRHIHKHFSGTPCAWPIISPFFTLKLGLIIDGYRIQNLTFSFSYHGTPQKSTENRSKAYLINFLTLSFIIIIGTKA
jgi:hypothetical protein